jgi:hypothetical protein
MHQTFVRTAVAVTCVLTLLAAAPARADDLDVVIRLYDMATGNVAGRAAAMRTAAEAIATAGLKVKWRDCSRGGAAHPCRTVRNAGDLVVRVMPARGAGSASATVSDGDGDVPLGFAPIDPSGRATVIATIYYDVVLGVAHRTGLGANQLLGRAIAHEIGHLLLRAPGHTGSGLMRPLWTDDELMRNQPADWTFSETDRRQVQAVARESETTASDAGDAEATGR